MTAIFAIPQIRAIGIDHARSIGIFAFTVYYAAASHHKKDPIAITIP